MSLHRLVYASKFKSGIDPSELAKIHQDAGRNNKKNEITGVLIFGNDYFLQYIEGTSESLNKLFRKVINDPRHEEVTLLDYSGIPSRLFQQWAMKLFMMTEENLKIAENLTQSKDYNPQKMDGATAQEFIQTFLAHR